MKKQEQLNFSKIPIDRRYYCMCCAAEICVKVDVKGYPYIYCGVCNVRVFFRSDSAQAGFLFFQKWFSRIQDKFRKALLVNEVRKLKPKKGEIMEVK